MHNKLIIQKNISYSLIKIKNKNKYIILLPYIYIYILQNKLFI